MSKKITNEELAVIMKGGFDGIDKRFEEIKKEIVTKNYLDEKLNPIKRGLFSLEQDMKRLENKIDRVIKANNEDILILNKEVEKLKKKMVKLENKVRVLTARRR